MSYRCDACGNKTRFDIFETKRVRAFHHYSLGGRLDVEEEEVLDSNIEKVVCRWCGSSDSIRGAGSAGPQEQRGAGSAGPQEQRDSESETTG
ncbi:MAG TPA: hypothetical protein VFD47_08910 [Actinomycetota bacterium]|nr:hypothetical protein [Actinomycetota bacterium]